MTPLAATGTCTSVGIIYLTHGSLVPYHSSVDDFGRLSWDFGGFSAASFARSRTFFGNNRSIASSVVHSFGSFFFGRGMEAS
jgi:hypothetical protein